MKKKREMLFNLRLSRKIEKRHMKLYVSICAESVL